METIICPFCQAENPVNNKTCSKCGHNLRVPVAPPAPIQQKIKPAEESTLPSETPAEDSLPESPKVGPLPETPLEDSQPKQPDSGNAIPSPESYATDFNFSSPIEAAGAFAQNFLRCQSGGKSLMLKSSARRRIIGSIILAVVLFLTLSMWMLYHRSHLIFIAILAVSIFLARRFVFTGDDSKALGKKLASMPDAEMESVLMSEYDQMAKAPGVRLICISFFAVAVAAVLLLFMTPHMIFEKTDGVVSLRFYSASIVRESSVTIPDTWNGEPVTQIRGNVFEGINWIRSVTLPNQLTTIRAHAFQGCGRLWEVRCPASLKEIGSSAFRNCSSLKQISLPRGCYVNPKAFKNSPTTITYFSGE